jgi:S1-C subfamily serine protease
MPQSTNPLLALSASLSGLVETMANTLVGVRSHGRLVANGFAWKRDAAVTASDALEADDEISLQLADGRTLAATLCGRDPTTDLAVLRLGDGSLQPVESSLAQHVRVGELVVALSRGRDGVAANLGMVSASGGPWQSLRGGNIDSLLRLDMRLEARAEGALVVAADGRALGMAVLGPRRCPLVIPMATIDRVAPRLVADGRIRRGYLGLGLQSIRLDEELAQAHALPSRRAVMVVSLDPKGPARAAGVHVGDILIGLDGEALPGVRSLYARLTPESVGRAAELRLVRAGGLATVKLTIGASPMP